MLTRSKVDRLKKQKQKVTKTLPRSQDESASPVRADSKSSKLKRRKGDTARRQSTSKRLSRTRPRACRLAVGWSLLSLSLPFLHTETAANEEVRGRKTPRALRTHRSALSKMLTRKCRSSKGDPLGLSNLCVYRETILSMPALVNPVSRNSAVCPKFSVRIHPREQLRTHTGVGTRSRTIH